MLKKAERRYNGDCGSAEGNTFCSPPVISQSGVIPKLDELQVFVQLSTPVVNVTLLAFAADRHAAVRRSDVRAAVDRYLLPAGRPAANPLHASAALDKWYIPGRRTDRRTDGRTDGRTPVRYIDSIPRTMRAVA